MFLKNNLDNDLSKSIRNTSKMVTYLLKALSNSISNDHKEKDVLSSMHKDP
jgi:hypothetical protein